MPASRHHHQKCTGILLIASLGLPMSLSGCTSIALGSLNGPGVCPPQVVQQAIINHNMLMNIDRSFTTREILSMATPEARRSMILNDGTAAEIWYFRTGHPRCAYLPTDQAFTPVVVGANGQFIGVGQAVNSFGNAKPEMPESGTEAVSTYKRFLRTVF